MATFTNTTTNTTTSSSTTQDDELIHLVTAVYLGLLAAMGAIGNIFVVTTVTRMSQMHHMTYILVGNLSAVGLLNCVLTIPMHMTHMLVGNVLWQEETDPACKALAHVNFGLVLCTLFNSAAIAVCRYRTVTARHSISPRTESTMRIIKLIFFVWALPLLVAISASPFLGFNALLSDCYFLDVDQAFWYMNLALTTPALISTLCMLTAYTLIIKKVRESHIKIANLCHKPVSITDNALQHSKEEEMVSESDHRARKDEDARNMSHKMGDPGPSNMGGIRIFTTMIPDESVNNPTTSYAADTFPPTTQFVEPETTDCTGAGREGAGLSCYLQPPLPSRLSDTGTIVKGGHRGREMLSVPSLSPSTMSEDSMHVSTRHNSILSSSTSQIVALRQSEMEGRGRRRFRKEVKLTLHLFLAFILFCLLYLPLCFAHLVHAFHVLGKEAWLVFYTLSLSFDSNAWLVYALLNRDFRRAFQALLRGRRSF